MKTACATFLSCVLMLAQVFLLPASGVAAGQSAGGAQVAAESCCGPKAHGCSCCVERSQGRPVQSAAVPAPASPGPLSAGQLSAVLTVLWSLPAPPTCGPTPATDASLAARTSVPLFLRHGVLLI